MQSMDIFVGRQPILTQNGDIYAYELLYRNSPDNFFPDVDADKATIELLVNTFLTIGVDQVVGKSLTFINFTGTLLAQDLFSSLDPDRVVIEILEDVEITPSLLTKIRALKTDGFKLALDDFTLREQYLVYEELFRLVDFIKIDFLNTTVTERNIIETYIKKYPNIQLLAEKIETKEQFNRAKNAGYKLFQGYYFAKPEIIQGVEIPQDVGLKFHIIQKLNEETPSIEEITELVMRDISLSYKLLRYINTLAFEVPKQIRSIKQALVLIGLRETRKWMQVLALQEIKERSKARHIQVLIDYSLTRAKLCELLAKRDGKKNPEEYFLAGMFSLMNIMMRRSWEEIWGLIPLSDEVQQTLKGEQTEITFYLQLAEAIERFDWEQITHYSQTLDITINELSQYALQAHSWTQRLE